MAPIAILDRTYYAANFDEYKITLIILDNYMAPDDRDENGSFVYSRGSECLNQEEVDCLTVVAVDTKRRRINMVRIGSNITCMMKELTFISLTY